MWWRTESGVVRMTRDEATGFGARAADPTGGPAYPQGIGGQGVLQAIGSAGWPPVSGTAGEPAAEPQLLACDVDGTLLDPNGVLRPSLRTAIDRIRAAGVTVILATGRSQWGTAEVCSRLGLDGPQITMNGGTFGSPVTGQLVWARRMSAEVVRDAVALARRLHSEPLFCFLNRHAIQAPAGDGPVEVPDFAVGPRLRTVRSVDALAGHGPVRIYNTTGPARHRSALNAAGDWLGPRASVVWSDTEGLEILAPGTNKGEALRAVAESMGFGPADVAAIGDGPNDLEMLRYAGRSAALLPAPPAVRAAAGSVVSSSADDGALEALRGFFPVTLASDRAADEDPDPTRNEDAA
jgi:5-amino-6-(5-phospho-D-ribitylamino)uracil phosphatase